MGNLDLDSGHMSTEGSLAFHYNECHAYSMRGSIGACCTTSDPGRIVLPTSFQPDRLHEVRLLRV